MFNCQVLQKENTQTVLLLHGLFTTAGFWLPVLRCFPRHRIVLLDIDYHQFLCAADRLAQLGEFLHSSFLSPNDTLHVVGHSFGSFLSASLVLPVARRYHLCPVFLVEHVELQSFQVEVGNRLGAAAPVSHLFFSQMDHALRLAQTVDCKSIAARGDCLMIPDADTFFTYRSVPNDAVWFRYSGGHFDVAEALESLFSI